MRDIAVGAGRVVGTQPQALAYASVAGEPPGEKRGDHARVFELRDAMSRG